MQELSGIRQRYLRFAERECKGYSDLYYRLAVGAAGDDDVLAFIAGMPDTQPNLFFACVQLLTGPDDMPTTDAELRTLVRRRAHELGSELRARRTQTNEVGRCGALLPALPPGPLALLEVGASAGLCLLLDRFHYDFGTHAVGDPSSPVHVRTAASERVPIPAAIPRVVWRRGIDARPVDVRDDDAVRWLLACVWSEHRERRRRLEAAIALARMEPPVVSAGDLVDDLPAALDDVPDDAQLVVFHSAVLTYVSPERREAFGDVLSKASRRREIVWLSNEAPGNIREITALAPVPSDHRFLLGRTRLTNGRRRDELLGLAHPHGGELTWL